MSRWHAATDRADYWEYQEMVTCAPTDDLQITPRGTTRFHDLSPCSCLVEHIVNGWPCSQFIAQFLALMTHANDKALSH